MSNDCGKVAGGSTRPQPGRLWFQQAIPKAVFDRGSASQDRCISLTEYDADAMIAPPSKGPTYSVIEIKLFSGRSLDAKRRLYAAIVDELSAFGVRAADIKIVLLESEPLNWGLGGLPASEIDLGFKIDV